MLNLCALVIHVHREVTTMNCDSIKVGVLKLLDFENYIPVALAWNTFSNVIKNLVAWNEKQAEIW